MICWACQAEHPPADCIEIDAVRYPVCRECWETIPAGQRIALAQRLRDAPSARAAWEAIRDLIRGHLNEGDLSWLWGPERDRPTE